MIFIDDLENIAEPNHCDAQQNLRSPTPISSAILVDFQGIVHRRFDKQTIQLCIFSFLVSFPVFCVIMSLSSEAEAGSAEEQPAKE
jgi:hypothetical protein